MDGGLALFAKEIIRHLGILNDNATDYELRTRLDSFCKKHKIEGSLEGNIDKKKDFTFEFSNQRVCCEPHLKLKTANTAGNTHRYEHRIYFYQDIEGGKILIGHIGVHL